MRGAKSVSQSYSQEFVIKVWVYPHIYIVIWMFQFREACVRRQRHKQSSVQDDILGPAGSGNQSTLHHRCSIN